MAMQSVAGSFEFSFEKRFSVASLPTVRVQGSGFSPIKLDPELAMSPSVSQCATGN